MLVLKTLIRLGPMHGYGIAQHIQQISDEVLRVEEGSLHPALQRMLVKGWVVADWKQSENNRRARFHQLTAKG
jgi:PadR family transcriptional regulator, regulatory protein PadR